MFTLGGKHFLWMFLKTVSLMGLLSLSVVLLKARTNSLLTPWNEASKSFKIAIV